MENGGCCPEGRVCSNLGEWSQVRINNGTVIPMPDATDSKCYGNGPFKSCTNGIQGCAPDGAECCDDGKHYCVEGQKCFNAWCCPEGMDECNQCDVAGLDMCGEHCMPKGKVCCGDRYCEAGDRCDENDGKCCKWLRSLTADIPRRARRQRTRRHRE